MNSNPICVLLASFRSRLASAFRRQSDCCSISPADLQAAIIRKQMSLRAAKRRMSFETKTRDFSDPDLTK